MAKAFKGKVPTMKVTNTSVKAGYVATKSAGASAANVTRSKVAAAGSRGTSNTRVESSKPTAGVSGKVGRATERLSSTVATRDKSFLGPGSTKTAKPKK